MITRHNAIIAAAHSTTEKGVAFRMFTISELNRTARLKLAVYASQGVSPPFHATLASWLLARLYQAVIRWVRLRGFRSLLFTLNFPLYRASRRTPVVCPRECVPVSNIQATFLCISKEIPYNASIS